MNKSQAGVAEADRWYCRFIISYASWVSLSSLPQGRRGLSHMECQDFESGNCRP